MKSFVVLSYYQLSHAIAMTLELGEKTNLYFSVSHLGVGEDFLKRIRETGLFHDVVMMNHRVPNIRMMEELEKTVGMSESEIDAIGSSLFEEYLGDFYSGIFKGADFDDDLYLYNDFQPHYYYIANHFHNIIGVEDGYGILEKQINLINNTGIDAFIHGKYKGPFIGKYWPEMQWKNDAVKTVLSSVPLTSKAPEYLRKKVKVMDYRDLVQKHQKEHKEALELIFDYRIPEIASRSSIVLTQPLYRNKYCSPLEDFLFHRKMILDEGKKSDVVYIKPHPADRIDYSVLERDNIVLLDRRFPVELLSDGSDSFARAVTFMSAAADEIAADEHVKYFNDVSPDRGEIVKAIKKCIAKETIDLSVFVRIRDCSPESFVNAYLIPGNHERVRTSIYLLFDQNADCDSDYFEPKYARERIKQYLEEKRKKKESVLWSREIKQIPQNADKIGKCFHFIDQADCSEKSIVELIRQTDCDLFFITDLRNSGIELRKDILKITTEKSLKKVQSYSSYTVIDDVRHEIGAGVTNSVMTNTLVNRLCHRDVLDKIEKDQAVFFGPLIPVCVGKDSLRSFVGSSYYVDPRDCKLLNETVESLGRQLMDSETADQEGCIIGEMAAWLFANNRPVNDLELIFKDIGYDCSAGLLRAYLLSAHNRNKENNRFTVRKASEFRYARGTLDNMLTDGTYEKVQKYYSLKKKLKKRTKRNK